MKKNQRLSGLIAATFTPMDVDGNINLSIIAPYARMLIDAGVQGVFICGTTGEAASLTMKERKSITEEWVRQVKGELKVIVHVGSNCQPDAIELANHARQCGAAAIAAIAPSFFKPATEKDLVDFFVPIAAEAPELPFYYYHMPAMTGVNLSVADFLLEGEKAIPNLAGVKFTHNNLMEMCDCLVLHDSKFEILHGYDEILIAGLALGSVAAVGSTFNYISPVYLGIIKAMKEGDIAHARSLQVRSVEMVKIINKYGGGVRGGKAIMNMLGILCGECRQPIASFTKEEYKRLKYDLKEYGLL